MGLWRRRHQQDAAKQELSPKQEERAAKKGKGKKKSEPKAEPKAESVAKAKDGSDGQAKA